VSKRSVVVCRRHCLARVAHCFRPAARAVAAIQPAATAGGNSSAKVAKIGVIAPLSGDLSALGLGIKNSVDLAIKQANDANAIPGWKLELAAEDDQATADVGKNAATKLAGDKDVIGVVGTLNSSVALQVQPVLASANIVQVSPGQHRCP
jgi:branched-chain amino acid transport system substrate-binding protein